MHTIGNRFAKYINRRAVGPREPQRGGNNSVWGRWWVENEGDNI